MKSLLICGSLAFALLPSPALAGTDEEYAALVESQAMDDVIVYLNHKDCKGAVKALNKGLASKQPGVMLMAGSMYEEGTCVKAEWDKAAHFYQLAHQAGKKEALPRLISGYAENNRDPGAALWWMAKNSWMPAACASANHLVNDPEAFVAALNKWPAGQVAACVYTAGVLMRVSGDVEFPGRAAERGAFGDAIMHFAPSAGTITWTAAAADRIAVTRMVDGSDNNERGVFKDTVLRHLQGISERALSRFKRPEGIDPAWKVDVRFSFSYR
jgi:hypothetical protein